MPTSYRGNDCTYKRATLLASLGSHTFDYDANGLRTRKNEIAYTYIGGKLIREENSGHTIDYIYGNDGITGIKYNGTVYLFRKNVFGDVTHIYDIAGTLHAHYVYDAWGNHTVVNDTETEIGDINPIRYRSYYYDTETKLYYLRARYYDPETGRFISQDNISYLDPQHLSGLNLYAYCANNAIMHIDTTGSSWSSFWKGVGDWFSDNWDIVVGVAATVTIAAISIATFGIATVAVGMVVGAVVGAGLGAINAAINGENVVYGAISGAVVGMLSGIGGPTIGGIICAGLGSAAGAATASLIGDRVNKREKNWGKAAVSAVTAGVFSACGSGASALLTQAGSQYSVQIVGNYIASLLFSTYTFVTDAIVGAVRGG